MALEWNQKPLDFLAASGLDRRIVEDAVRSPTSIEVDPRSAELGHPVRRLRRGDVEVVVGYQEPDMPRVLYVRLLLDNASHGRGATRYQSGAGAGGGSSTPPTVPEMHRRITALGYSITSDTRHAKVYTADGRLLATLPRTPSDRRSLANTWSDFKLAHNEEMKRTP